MKKEKQEELSFDNEGKIKQLADELLESIEKNSEEHYPSSSSTADIESINHIGLIEQALEKFTEEKHIDQEKIEVDKRTEETLTIDQTDQTEVDKTKEKIPIEQTTEQQNPEFTNKVEKTNLREMVEQALDYFNELEPLSQEDAEKNNQFENGVIEGKNTPIEIQEFDTSSKEFEKKGISENSDHTQLILNNGTKIKNTLESSKVEKKEITPNLNNPEDADLLDVLTSAYKTSDKITRVNLLSNKCNFIREESKKILLDHLLRVHNRKNHEIISNDEIKDIFVDIAMKTQLCERKADIRNVFVFNQLITDKKGSAIISNNGLHLLTFEADIFTLANEIKNKGLNSDTFNSRLELKKSLFEELAYNLESYELKHFSQALINTITANKDTNSAFVITATHLTNDNLSQIKLTDEIVTESDKKKLIEYLKIMEPQFDRRTYRDIYKYSRTYDSLHTKVVSKIDRREREITDLLGNFSIYYDWQGWKYINQEVNGVEIRFNTVNQDINDLLRIQILGKQTEEDKKTIKDLGIFVNKYQYKKTKIPREISYNKIRHTPSGKNLFRAIKFQSKVMLDKSDSFMENLFPMIDLSIQSSNRILSQSGTRVLNDYRLMKGPDIDYNFSILQNFHITNEVPKIEVKIRYGIGYEISLNKEKFDIFREKLDQEITRRALILEAFQKNVLTQYGAKELPGSGQGGYFSQLFNIYENSPSKGWKDILLKDPIYQFYNGRVKQLSMTSGKLKIPDKGWEKGRITSIMTYGDTIFGYSWLNLNNSSKILKYPSNLFVKRIKNNIIKKKKTTRNLLVDRGLTVQDIKNERNIAKINRGLQRFQRGNENGGGTELFKEYIEKLLGEERQILGKNGLGLNQMKKYSVHLEYSIAKNNTYENFNYSIGAPDVVIKNMQTNEPVALIHLKGYSQNESGFFTSNSFFQMLELKLLTEITNIKTAFLHITEKNSYSKHHGKIEDVNYDWLIFEKSSKVKKADLEEALLHTFIVRQLRSSSFSENIFTDMIESSKEEKIPFDNRLELAINKRKPHIIEKLEKMRNDIVQISHAHGFEKIIPVNFFNKDGTDTEGINMTKEGVDKLHYIVQHEILGYINKNDLEKAFNKGQGTFQYHWNKTILLDCWVNKMIENFKENSPKN